MMVAVPCSGLCQANAIFELKYDTISQLFYSTIVNGPFLEDSQSKPLFPDRTILYSCYKYTSKMCPLLFYWYSMSLQVAFQLRPL